MLNEQQFDQMQTSQTGGQPYYNDTLQMISVLCPNV